MGGLCLFSFSCVFLKNVTNSDLELFCCLRTFLVLLIRMEWEQGSTSGQRSLTGKPKPSVGSLKSDALGS